MISTGMPADSWAIGKVGDSMQARHMCRRMINSQISPLSVSVDSQDIFDDLMAFKERALTVHIMKLLPGFTLKTPAMKRTAKAIDTLLARVQSVHTPSSTSRMSAESRGRPVQPQRQ